MPVYYSKVFFFKKYSIILFLQQTLLYKIYPRHLNKNLRYVFDVHEGNCRLIPEGVKKHIAIQVMAEMLADQRT